MTTTAQRPMLTTADIASRTGRCTETVLRWWRSGLIPAPTSIVGRSYLWPVEVIEPAIEELLAERGGQRQ